MRFERPGPATKLDNLAVVRQFFEDCLDKSDSTKETLWIAYLDEEYRCRHLSSHLGNESSVEPPLRQIVAELIAQDTVSIVMAHNHPSGDTTPSQTDLRITRRLADVASFLDCRVLDHLILAKEGDCTSFRQRGLL